MRKMIFLITLFGFLFLGCAGLRQNKEVAEFSIETLAMTLGYEVRDSFVWSDEVQKYYDAVMVGNITLSAVTTAEVYLKENTHPIIVNRMIRLGEMSGFDSVDGSIIGIDNVNIEYLQTAFTGFKIGIELQ
jgi:hypothetical protein